MSLNLVLLYLLIIQDDIARHVQRYLSEENTSPDVAVFFTSRHWDSSRKVETPYPVPPDGVFVAAFRDTISVPVANTVHSQW